MTHDEALVWMALISGAFGFFTVIGNAIVVALAAYLTMAHQKGMAANIQKIETATNSTKDALIVSTDKEAHERGRREGKAEQKAEQTKQQP